MDEIMLRAFKKTLYSFPGFRVSFMWIMLYRNKEQSQGGRAVSWQKKRNYLSRMF